MAQSEKKKVYVCKHCNAYMTKDYDEPVPLCCGKAMIEMDEVDENEIYEEKSSSSGM